MSDIVKQEENPVSASVLEHILGTGDLSKLTTQGRVEYYTATCRSLGLNPLTRPMRFLSLNGQIQLYFTRDGTDQLRKAQGITLHVVDKVIEAGLFTVTVRARAKDGREDEDIGAVVLPQSGESRANALMKAMTKAKRRVTLSICGLGQTDESELDTMPGARVFDAEDELPVAPIREQMNRDVPLKAAAAPMPRGARVAERAPAYEAPPGSTSAEKPLPDYTDAQWDAWIAKLRNACGVVQHRQELVEMADPKRMVGKALAEGPDWVKRDISEILAKNYQRFAEASPEEPEAEALDEVAIFGEEKVMSGDD